MDWILYILFFVASCWPAWRFRFDICLGGVTGLQKLASLSTISAGVAVVVAIITKLVGEIVGLFPESLKRAVEAGRREQDIRWADWLARMEEAQRKGEAFNEPPPYSRRRD